MNTTPTIGNAVARFDCDGPEPCAEGRSVIGTECTPALLADLAKTPRLRSMEVSATPGGQRIASYTRRYTDERECKTTFFDVGDEELASITVDCDAGGERFGSVLGCDVEGVTVSSRPDGLGVSFVFSQWLAEDRDEVYVVVSAGSSVDFRSEFDTVSAIEETHTGFNTVTSFFEDDASDEPWLVLVEPD